MVIRLLKESYLNSDNIYKDFINNQIESDLDHFSDEYFVINNAKPFPIYIADKNEKDRELRFMEAFNIIEECYLNLDRDVIMSQQFWHTLFLVLFRDYIVENYPIVLKNKNIFKNVLLKKFDWENYIYKCLFAVEYVCDMSQKNEKEKLYKTIINNLDLYNYLIKYTVFRNNKFIITILRIVEKNDYSNLLKAKIKNRPDLGNDERYGRRVLFEFNKEYPIVLSPMMEEKEIELLFIKHLNNYLLVDSAIN